MIKKLFSRNSIFYSVGLIGISFGLLAVLGVVLAPPPVEPPSDEAIYAPLTTFDLALDDRYVRLVERLDAEQSRLMEVWQEAKPGSVLEDSLTELVKDVGHLRTLISDQYPSAHECAACHPDHFGEWAVSQHAYAQLSPVYSSMQAAINVINNGTNGDFCFRCHSPVGGNISEPTFISNMDRSPTAREGITCITCHRVENPYGKVSGRLAIAEGDLFEVVYGTLGPEILNEIIEDPSVPVNTDPERSGRSIHATARKFAQLSTSAQCGTCHDVNLVNGFRLEEAFSEFKSMPAAARGVKCQDCHMASVPGVESEYNQGPVAVVGRKESRPRKRTDHHFDGPDYSLIHPGLFPHNAEANALATMREWLEFDVEAGWGTDAFEDQVDDGFEFPDRWSTPDDRYTAREIIEDNLASLENAHERRLAVLRAGYGLGDITVDQAGPQGIKFNVEVKNLTDGHQVPTGFDGERLVFLQITVTDADGQVVFKSGDRDPNGDVRDHHSLYVHNGELPVDKYLFNLQSQFLTRMVRGGERHQVLPLNVSPSPLPFLRPSTRSTVLLGRPLGARKHRTTIPGLSSVWAPYEVKASELQGTRGPYQANVKLIAQMVPVNLIHEIEVVGFDYNMSTRELADRVVEGALTLYDRDVALTP